METVLSGIAGFLTPILIILLGILWNKFRKTRAPSKRWENKNKPLHPHGKTFSQRNNLSLPHPGEHLKYERQQPHDLLGRIEF
jgi:hypothetical protein